jgi:hypothetical protein
MDAGIAGIGRMGDRQSNINFYGYRRAYLRIGMVGDF